MTASVSLQELIDELQMLSDESQAYLNRVTGKVIAFSDDDIALAEHAGEFEDEEDETGGDAENGASDPEMEFFQEVQRILAADPDYLKLPSRFEINEYEIVERFALSFPDARISEVLLGNIKGAGAFRRFKDTIYEHGIEQEWFDYRDAAYRELAIAWLDDHGLAYTDDTKGREQAG